MIHIKKKTLRILKTNKLGTTRRKERFHQYKGGSGRGQSSPCPDTRFSSPEAETVTEADASSHTCNSVLRCVYTHMHVCNSFNSKMDMSHTSFGTSIFFSLSSDDLDTSRSALNFLALFHCFLRLLLH